MSEQNKRLIREITDVIWNGRSLDRIPEFYAPDFVGDYRPYALREGHEGVRAMVDGAWTAFPDYHEEVHELIAEGDRVVLHLTISGTQRGQWGPLPPTGKPATFDEIVILQIRDGKVLGQRGIVDNLSALRQLGAVPSLVLRGPTVTLRPLSDSDTGALAAAAGESRDEYGWTRVPSDLDDARRYIETALAERTAGRRLPFAIVWDGRIVGSTSYLDLQHWRWPAGSPHQRPAGEPDVPDVVEIGATWLAASAQRTRCNTEAKHLMLSHAFDVWRVHRVGLKTDERNTRSRRAIERLGARLEGLRRADMPGQDGSVRTSAYYSIVRAEWPDVRRRLEEALTR